MKYLLSTLLFLSHLAFATLCDQVFNEMAIHQIPEEARVVHVPQIHYTRSKLNYPPEYDRFYREKTTKIQFSIARIIMNYPDEIYVYEGFLSSIGLEEKTHRDHFKFFSQDNRSLINRKTIQESMDLYFYKKNYNELTYKEKELLYKEGAMIILFLLGHIDFVYSSTKDKKVSEQIHETIRELSYKGAPYKEIYPFLYQKRELLLKEQVEELSKLHPDKKIFFIYGLLHDFSYLFDQKYFYRMPHSSILPEEYLKHPDHGAYLLSKVNNTFWFLHSQKRLSKEIIQRMVSEAQESSDILKDFVQNRTEEDIGLFNLKADRYFSNKEVLKKSKEALAFKEYLENQLNKPEELWYKSKTPLFIKKILTFGKGSRILEKE